MQQIDIGKLPSRETRNHRQHRGVWLWESSGSNLKPPFYFTQKFFRCMAILSTDDQSVISKYENLSLRSTCHCLFNFSGERYAGRCVRNPLPGQAGQPLCQQVGPIETYRPRNSVDRVHVKDNTMPKDGVHSRFNGWTQLVIRRT